MYDRIRRPFQVKYQCVMREDEAPARWPAQIRLISRNQTSIEVEIRGRGSSFYVIVGSGAFETTFAYRPWISAVPLLRQMICFGTVNG